MISVRRSMRRIGPKKDHSRKSSVADGRKRASGKGSEWVSYHEKDIVVDTSSHFVFIGKLRDVSDSFITLSDADAHDRRESPSMNEKYILEAKKYGVRINRKLVHIRLDTVISFSLLDDVQEY